MQRDPFVGNFVGNFVEPQGEPDLDWPEFDKVSDKVSDKEIVERRGGLTALPALEDNLDDHIARVAAAIGRAFEQIK